MYKKLGFTSYQTAVIQLGVILLVLYWISTQSYLLFHSVIETVVATILLVVFIITWNAKRYLDNHYFLLVGIASLFIAAIAILHLLSYKGMGIFPGDQANLPTQLWLAARYLTAATFLAAPFIISKKINIPFTVVAYTTIFLIIILAIFEFKIFPQAYVEGVGLTDFKKNSEYVISFMFIVSAILVYWEPKHFDQRIKWLLALSLVTAAVSEISFTEYASVYGPANMLGHMFLLVSFFLLYLGIIETALRRPSRVLYKNLRDIKNDLKTEVQKRTLELEKSYSSLKEAYKQLELRNALRKLAINSKNKKEYFDGLVGFVQELFGASCVGIRELDEKKDIPYGSYVGFSRNFWKMENQLDIDNDTCLCTRVFKGSLDLHEKGASSLGGSFFCGNAQNFYASLAEEEKARHRGLCFRAGYQSLAIVPIFEGNKVIAAIHLADKKEGLATKEKVNLLESVTYLISMAINNFNTNQKLEEYKRALLVLSEGNRILVHAKSEKALVDEVCEMIVKKGSFVGAWVGYAQHDADKSIKVISQWGLKDGLIEKQRLNWDRKDKRDYPARYAIITGKTQTRKFINFSDGHNGFRNFGREAGFKSALSLSLIESGTPFGALTIFSKEPNTFHGDEIKLLEELARDLAYGITAVRTKNAHQRSQKELIESYKHLGTVNRKISLLIEMGKEHKLKGNKEIAKYIVNSAINMSQAKFGILYRYQEDKKLHLVSAQGLDKPISQDFIEIVPQSYNFLKDLFKRKDQVEGNAENYQLGCFNINGKVKCFLALPLNDNVSRKVKGVLYLGFVNKKTLTSQELEFYDMFIKTASQALVKANLIK